MHLGQAQDRRPQCLHRSNLGGVERALPQRVHRGQQLRRVGRWGGVVLRQGEIALHLGHGLEVGGSSADGKRISGWSGKRKQRVGTLTIESWAGLPWLAGRTVPLVDAWVGGPGSMQGGRGTASAALSAVEGSPGGSAEGRALCTSSSDHLGSQAITVNGTTGAKVAEVRYKPWGEDRWASGTTPTTYRYTGQRKESAIGLYYYGARWYDPALARFVQADTVVPNPGDPQYLNRYSYVLNQP